MDRDKRNTIKNALGVAGWGIGAGVLGIEAVHKLFKRERVELRSSLALSYKQRISQADTPSALRGLRVEIWTPNVVNKELGKGESDELNHLIFERAYRIHTDEIAVATDAEHLSYLIGIIRVGSLHEKVLTHNLYDALVEQIRRKAHDLLAKKIDELIDREPLESLRGRIWVKYYKDSNILTHRQQNDLASKIDKKLSKAQDGRRVR